MHSSVSSSELGEAVRAALARGDAERLEEEVKFVSEALRNAPLGDDRDLDELLARLSRGESPYTVIGRYPIAETQHWIEVPVGVMPPGCDTVDAIAVIRHVLRERNPRVIADVGCGTGVLGFAALLSGPLVRCAFLDVDSTACAAVHSNAKRLGLLHRSSVVCDDAERSLVRMELDLVVANLPFVPTREVPALGARFRDFAPRRAVDGGKDGMAVYNRLSDALHAAVRPSGNMILQFGGGQRQAVLASLGPRWVECREDSLGYPNLVVVRRMA